jgi:hypothetical protein
LLLYPVAVVLLAPFGWLYAFFQNVTVIGDETVDVTELFKRAWRQALLWPTQNFTVLFCYKLLGLFVLLNLLVGVIAVPMLLKTVLGMETVFSQSPSAMFNTTLLATVFGMTYLCLDPFLKATYALRCFYGESLRTAQDLKAELRRSPSRPTAVAARAVLILGVVLTCSDARAAQPAPDTTPRSSPGLVVSAVELDRAIEEIIQRREYSWRMPRERPLQEQDDGTEPWVERIFKKIESWIAATGRGIRDLLSWLRWRPTTNPSRSRFAVEWFPGLRVLVIVLAAALLALAGLLLWRMWRRRRDSFDASGAPSALPMPEIANEDVGANELPEDGWLGLARELMDRGESRLALRALYFATLAHLAERNLITIARFKSNRDYERELSRRGHVLPEVLNLFGQNVKVFDRTWYGLHEVSPDLVDQFSSNMQTIRNQS